MDPDTLICRSELDPQVSYPEHWGQNLPSWDQGENQECKTWDALVKQGASNSDKENMWVWVL